MAEARVSSRDGRRRRGRAGGEGRRDGRKHFNIDFPIVCVNRDTGRNTKEKVAKQTFDPG